MAWVAALLLAGLAWPVGAGERAVLAGFSLDAGQRMVGSEYRVVAVATLARCAQLCYRRSLCRAFSYHRGRHLCRLNARVVRTRSDRLSVIGVKIGGSRAPAAGSGTSTSAAETRRLGRIRIEYAVERPGVGYRQLHLDYPEDCARACDRDSGCWSFGYRPRSRACTLFDTLETGRAARGQVSGVKRAPDDGSTDAVRSVSRRGGFVIYRDLVLYGSEHRRLRAFSLDYCADSCRADIACRAFSYHPGEAQCVLKSVQESRRYRRGVISGIRAD